jgi:cytochrome c biogenesis protein CcmG/thiol:disulfide interchange protein DsbE
MQKLIIFTLFFLFICKNISYGGTIEDFTLSDLNNKRSSFSDLKGENLTILDFWATWCKPCARAIPKLVSLYDQYKDKGVQFIGISVDSPRNLPKVKPYANTRGITYPILLDSNNELMSKLQITALPTVLVVNARDEIVFVHRGYRPGDEKILQDEIDKLLSEKSAEENDK